MMNRGLKLELLQFLSLQKDLNSYFCGDLRPVLTADPKSTIKELSESYWHVRGV